MKKSNIIPILVIVISCVLSCNPSNENKITQVLVVGTTHAHDRNPNFTYYDLVNIIETYNPDVICVEIPPSYFRKRSYLYEMMLATIYGIENNCKVYPIDSWETASGGNDRALRSDYIKTDEYKLKETQYYNMVDSNSVMQSFIKKYGSLNELWNRHDKDYGFFNGNEYNDYIKEMYAINVSVFGDGCMNLSYLTRNNNMLELINTAIEENKGSHVLVLTGAEHKHYFDIALANQDSIKVLDFNEILPIREKEISKNISDFIEKKLARGYYDVSDSSGIDLMFSGALIELIHGMGMDDDPSIIPAENIEKTKPVIEEWESMYSHSIQLQFEKGWILFLGGDYVSAITVMESISNNLDKIPEYSKKFVIPFYYRNLGFCYDMTGDRENAVECYKNCRDACDELGINESYAKTIYKDYEIHPYHRQINQ